MRQVTKLPEKLNDLQKQFLEFEASEKEAKKAKEVIKNKMIKYLKDSGHVGYEIDGKIAVKYSIVETNRFDTATLKDILPEVYTEYLIPSERKQFICKEIK